MTTTTNKPTQDVFEMVLARLVADPDLQHGRLVHLAWRAPQQGDRLVEFYVSGQLAGFSLSPTQRDAWLVVDHAVHTQIELLAVSPEWAAVDFSGHLAGVEPATQPAASLRLMRDVSLPADSIVSVAVDDVSASDESPLFSTSDPRGGFGAVFGEGGFGYDASIGPGLGRGSLGDGPLGSDGDALRWFDTLLAGPHTINVSLRDDIGLPAAEAIHLDITIDPLPLPPSNVTLTTDFNLTWT